MDLSVNKCAKDFLKSEFQQFYADHVMKQVREGKDMNEINVDLSLSAMKEVGAKWLVKLYDYLKTRKNVITNGFTESGLLHVPKE